MVITPKAYLFDLNGTMIDDMRYHAISWHELLTDLGAKLTHEEVKVQMYGKSTELLERVFGKGHFSAEELERLSLEKAKLYQKALAPHLKLIVGLPEFLEDAKRQRIPMAIGSAAIPFNINFILDNLNIRSYFDAIVSADDVKESKPHPETFLKAAALLGIDPAECIVFEDAPKGVESAQNAGMPCVVLTTMHEKEDFKQYTNIIRYIKDYTDIKI